MKSSLVFLVVGVAALGWGLFDVTWDPGDPVTCHGQLMQTTDTCPEPQNGSTVMRSYDDEKNDVYNTHPLAVVALILGAMLAAGGVAGVVQWRVASS